jgi:Protein of unknown function (DUF3035)
MKPSHSLIFSGLSLLLLAACGNVRDDLGLGRSTPDEFAVVDRAPLSVPPEFTLRPPDPGAGRPQEVDTKQRAENTLFGDDKNKPAAAKPSTGESGTEKTVLANAGAANADPNIRSTVDREAAEKVVASPHLVDSLLWWKRNQLPGVTVDATAEAARIKDAKAKNEPLNQGATPIIEQQKTGWLGL